MFYNFKKNKKAFTLVELIVVIAIIAILGTVAGIAVSSVLARARRTAATSPLNDLYNDWTMWDGTKDFKTFIKEDAFPQNYSSFYVSDNSKLTKKSFGSGDTFSIYYHDDSSGDYWGELKINKGVPQKVGDPLSSAPATKTQIS